MAPALRKRGKKQEVIISPKINRTAFVDQTNVIDECKNASSILDEKKTLKNTKGTLSKPGKETFKDPINIQARKVKKKVYAGTRGRDKENPKGTDRKQDHNRTYEFFKNVVFHSTLNESRIANLENDTSSGSDEKDISVIAKEAKKGKVKSGQEKPTVASKKVKNSCKENFMLDNCFGFNDLSVNISAPIKNKPKVIDTSFQCDKPWRCAFNDVLNIIKKNEVIKQRSFMKNTIVNCENTLTEKTVLDIKPKKTVKIVENPSICEQKTKKPIKKKEVKPPAKSNLVQKKITDMGVEKVKPNTRKTTKASKFETFFDKSNTSDLFPQDVATPDRDKPARRLYHKKPKVVEIEEDEPSSEDVFAELKRKKDTKQNAKRPKKEEKDMEEWSKSINSMFDEVDKFELHID